MSRHSKKQYSLVADFRLYRRLIRYLSHYWIAFVIAMLGNIFFSSIDAGFTYMLKPILNKGFIARDIHFIRFLPFLILGAFLLRGICNVAATYCMSIVSRGVVMRFRQDIFGHLLKLPATYYDNVSTGQVLSIILYNVEQVANAGADAITDLIQSGCLILGLLVVMFTISWQLSLLFLVVVPLIATAVRATSKYLRRLSSSIQMQMGSVTNIAEEAVEGYKVVRAFGGQEYESNKFNRATEINRQRELKGVFIKAASVSGIQLLAGIVLSITIYIVTLHKLSTRITPGGFASLVAAMLALLKPLKTFTTVNATIQKGLAGAQSIFGLLDQPAEVDNGTTHLKRAQGEIAFQGVSFVYPNTSKSVLKEMTFSVRPGQCVALVGKSGAGKSTLVNVLQRFYDGFSGEILIDGKDIREYVMADLRQQFAFVSQHVTLFNDTIAHNIAYGRFAEATHEEIMAAAKAAYAWEFIETLPNQLNTLVGENGVLLSGGQRQRLAIARAILKNSPILILDEATSALDTEAEREIQTALSELMTQRTTVVIAHRLSTIEHADMILVLDHGQIIEAGTHRELLAQSGHYAKLYKMQFKDE